MRGRCRRYGDDVRLVPDALGRELAEPLASIVTHQVFDRDVLTVHVAQLAQSLEESRKPRGRRFRCTGVERDEAESWDSPWLRLGHERRSEKTRAERPEEGPS